MRALFWLLAVFAAAVALVILGRVGAGYVMFVYPPYRVELSLLFFVVASLAGFLLLYAAMRLLGHAVSLPTYVRAYRARRRRERAHAALAAALQAYYEGRYARAEKEAAAAFEAGPTPGLAALLAARAAHQMRDFERRDRWLERAEEAGEGLQAARLVSRAEFALEERDFAAARDALRTLQDPSTLPRRACCCAPSAAPVLGTRCCASPPSSPSATPFRRRWPKNTRYRRTSSCCGARRAIPARSSSAGAASRRPTSCSRASPLPRRATPPRLERPNSPATSLKRRSPRSGRRSSSPSTATCRRISSPRSAPPRPARASSAASAGCPSTSATPSSWQFWVACARTPSYGARRAAFSRRAFRSKRDAARIWISRASPSASARRRKPSATTGARQSSPEENQVKKIRDRP